MDTKGLAGYAENGYKATAGLTRKIPAGKLDWRPDEENNWMTIGQLLLHLTEATGPCMKGFLTGEWPEMPEEGGMVTDATKLPSVASVDEALEKLEADRGLTAQLLADLSEEDFTGRMVEAPWAPGLQLPLWTHLLGMVEHQASHKTTLFNYLKLLGVPVNTMDLYGMAE